MLLLLLLIGGGSSAWGEEITFTAPEGWTAAGEKQSSTKEGVTISTTKGAGDVQYRIYKSETFTVSSTVGNITKIEITCTANDKAKYGPGSFEDIEGYSYSGKIGTWMGSATSVSLKASTNQVRATKIVVTVISGGDTPGTPVNLTAPTNLVATNVTATTATLSWNKVENASSYTLKIGEKEIENVVAPYTAEGLTASTEYTWSVKAVGDGSRYISSEYATGEAFTTQKEDGTATATNEVALSNALYGITEGNNEIEQSVEKDGLKIVSGCLSSASNKTYYAGSHIRYYAKSYLKLTAPEGLLITKVQFVEPAKDKDKKWNNGPVSIVGAYNNSAKLWTGSASQIDFSFNDQNRIAKIIVFYASAPTLTSLAISGTPNQTTYQDGEAFDPAGLVVTGAYDDGSTRQITNGVTWKISPEKLTTGTTSVEVKASVENVTSEVFTVNGLTVKEKVTLICIGAKGTPAAFWKGDKFNNDGIKVTALWSDDSETDVTSDCKFTAPDMNTAGKKTVTVTYENETCTYEIEVKTIENTKETAYTVSKAIALIDAGKDLTSQVYVKGIVSKIVTPFDPDSKFGNVSFNVSVDGSTEGEQFMFFRTQKDAKNKYTEDPNIEVGATVIGCGTLDKYNDIYEFKAGNYLVSYVAPYTAQTLTFVAKSNGAYWATFSSDKVVFMPSNDVDVYTVVVEGNKLTTMSGKDEVFGLEETLSVGGESVKGYYIPANTGVLLYSLEETLTYYTFENKTVDAVDADFNMLKPASEKMTEGFKYYKLAYDNFTEKTGLGFYWGAAEGGAFTVKPGLAYLAVPQAQAANVKGFSFDGTQTGINGVEATTAKGAIYNLNGQRVEKAQRGIYIQNGKKFIVK